MNAVRERATISFTARAHADGKLQQHLLAEFSAGQLGHERLLRFLRDGDVAGLEIGLSLHARLELNHVRRLLYHADRRHLAALVPRCRLRHAALSHAAHGAGDRRGGDGAAPWPARATAPTRSGSCRRSTSSSAATRRSCGSCWATEPADGHRQDSRRSSAPQARSARLSCLPASRSCQRLIDRQSTAPPSNIHRISHSCVGAARSHGGARRATSCATPCSTKEPPALAPDETGTFRVQPHNIEAEQALLGAILVNNEAYHRVGELPARRAFLRAGARPDLRALRRDGSGAASSPTRSPSSGCSRRTRHCASWTARAI